MGVRILTTWTMLGACTYMKILTTLLKVALSLGKLAISAILNIWSRSQHHYQESRGEPIEQPMTVPSQEDLVSPQIPAEAAFSISSGSPAGWESLKRSRKGELSACVEDSLATALSPALDDYMDVFLSPLLLEEGSSGLEEACEIDDPFELRLETSPEE